MVLVPTSAQPSAPTRPRRRDVQRRRPAAHHPTTTRPRRPEDHIDLPGGNRQHGDCPRGPRTTRADDLRQQRTQSQLTLALGDRASLRPPRARSSAGTTTKRLPSALGGSKRQAAAPRTLPFAAKDSSESSRPHDPDAAVGIVTGHAAGLHSPGVAVGWGYPCVHRAACGMQRGHGLVPSRPARPARTAQRFVARSRGLRDRRKPRSAERVATITG